jgi:hypothetical protein
MLVKIEVKTPDDDLRKRREDAARLVVDRFEDRFPNRRLLCFFDDEEWQGLIDAGGPSVRGFYCPISAGGGLWLPPYVAESLVVDSAIAFEDLIYLPGSTCSIEVALIMTFVHEVQHFVQHGVSQNTWGANELVRQLFGTLAPPQIRALGVASWCDVPYERDAQIAAKRAAEQLLGVRPVEDYIAARIVEHATGVEAALWRCIKELDSSAEYDLTAETVQFFPRLKTYRRQLEECLRTNGNDVDFKGVDLDKLLAG